MLNPEKVRTANNIKIKLNKKYNSQHLTVSDIK